MSSVTMLDNALEVLGEILADLLHLLAVVVIHWPVSVGKQLLQFLHQLLGDLREVLHEVQRILDLVGDTGGEFA